MHTANSNTYTHTRCIIIMHMHPDNDDEMMELDAGIDPKDYHQSALSPLTI